MDRRLRHRVSGPFRLFPQTPCEKKIRRRPCHSEPGAHPASSRTGRRAYPEADLGCFIKPPISRSARPQRSTRKVQRSPPPNALQDSENGNSVCATARTCRNVISCVDLPTRPMSVLPRSESLRHHLDDSDRLRRFSRDPSGRFHRVKLAGLASWTRGVGPDDFSRDQKLTRSVRPMHSPSGHHANMTRFWVCHSRPISRESGIMFSEMSFSLNLPQGRR